jgi:hypothetical protein
MSRVQRAVKAPVATKRAASAAKKKPAARKAPAASSLTAQLARFEQKMPRVLYTWVGQQKLDAMINQFQGGEGFFTQVAATRTPLSTFMYGPILVRMKLRPVESARTAAGDRYFKLQGADREVTTHLRQVDLAPLKLREYVLDMVPEVVESFSYGTADILGELKLEQQLPEDVDLAFRERSGKPVLFSDGAFTIDGHAWNQAVLDERFRTLEQQVKHRPGHVFYAPGVDPAASPHFTPEDLPSQLLSVQRSGDSFTAR